METNGIFLERMECPVCLTSNIIRLFSVPYSSKDLQEFIFKTYSKRGGLDKSLMIGAHYELCECRSCKLLFQKFIPVGELLHQIYNPKYDEKTVKRKSTTKSSTSMRFLESEAEVIDSFLKGKNQKILDFGVGYGVLASRLINKG